MTRQRDLPLLKVARAAALAGVIEAHRPILEGVLIQQLTGGLQCLSVIQNVYQWRRLAMMLAEAKMSSRRRFRRALAFLNCSGASCSQWRAMTTSEKVS